MIAIARVRSAAELGQSLRKLRQEIRPAMSALSSPCLKAKWELYVYRAVHCGERNGFAPHFVKRVIPIVMQLR